MSDQMVPAGVAAVGSFGALLFCKIELTNPTVGGLVMWNTFRASMVGARLLLSRLPT